MSDEPPPQPPPVTRHEKRTPPVFEVVSAMIRDNLQDGCIALEIVTHGRCAFEFHFQRAAFHEIAASYIVRGGKTFTDAARAPHPSD